MYKRVMFFLSALLTLCLTTVTYAQSRTAKITLFSEQPYNVDKVMAMPVIALYPSTEIGPDFKRGQGNALTLYYLDHGLRSFYSPDVHEELRKRLLDAKELSGLIVQSYKGQNSGILYNFINRLVVPEDYRISSLIHTMSGFANNEFSIVFLAPKQQFESLQLVGLTERAKLTVREYEVNMDSPSKKTIRQEDGYIDQFKS